LYKVFERNEIDVTRSWYRYGCFIHSNELSTSGGNFSSLRNRFIRTGNTFLRSQVQELGINTAQIAEDIVRVTDEMPVKVDDYIENLYCNEAPDGLGSIYQSKFKLANLLFRAECIGALRNNPRHQWLTDVRSSFSLFQMAAFANTWYSDITEITLDFTSTAEQALLKADRLLSGGRLLARQARCLGALHNFFDQQVWLPFASTTSAKTVKGLRRCEIARRENEKHIREVQNSTAELAMFSRQFRDVGLSLSLAEYSDIARRTHINELLREKLSEMEKLYDLAR
jgi:hypothetical protein